MHQALLIDEILQVILDSCTESTLGRVARTCQAWKDPALDRLWCRLSSFRPLLLLVPGLLCIDGIYTLESSLFPDFQALRRYASRVKQIAFRHSTQIHSTLLSLLLSDGATDFIFRNLASLQLSLTHCHSLSSILSLTTELKTVDLDLGFKTSAFQTSNDSACDLLSNVDRVSTGFTSLSLRGATSERLLNTVTSLFHVQSLNLRLGSTLTHDAIAVIATFPVLATLELQASHLQADNMCFSCTSSCFPALRSLNVSACAAFIEILLRSMQTEQLRSLRIDVEPVTATWADLFDAIKERTKTSLHDLTIEHHIDTEDLELDDSPSSDTPSNTSTPTGLRPTPSAILQFDTLRSLANHHHLRRIVFDTTPPILVRDQDFEQMAKWWPQLEHLDLGSLPTLDERWQAKTTAAGLALLSQRFSSLDSLVIPVDATGLTDAAVATLPQKWNPLRSITLTSLTPPPELAMANCLRRLFPALEEIHGTTGHEERWNVIHKDFLQLTQNVHEL